MTLFIWDVQSLTPDTPLLLRCEKWQSVCSSDRQHCECGWAPGPVLPACASPSLSPPLAAPTTQELHTLLRVLKLVWRLRAGDAHDGVSCFARSLPPLPSSAAGTLLAGAVLSNGRSMVAFWSKLSSDLPCIMPAFDFSTDVVLVLHN